MFSWVKASRGYIDSLVFFFASCIYSGEIRKTFTRSALISFVDISSKFPMKCLAGVIIVKGLF